MNDPHVEFLRYDFIAVDSRHDFSAASPWEGQLGDFQCRLEADGLEARPLQHRASEEAARGMLEPHLRAWELRSELEDAILIEFRFDTARIVDRQPTPGVTEIAINMVAEVDMAGEITFRLGHHVYPAPSPRVLARSGLVEELMVWVRELRGRKQPMLVPAYLVLTRLEYEYGDRRKAAAALNVSKDVLSKLGELAARNDPAERRKVKGPITLLTEPERQWLLAAIPKLALQVAAVDAGLRPALLDMAGLPTV